MRRHNREKAHGIVMEKYVTITATKISEENAESYFERMEEDLSKRLKSIGSTVRRLSSSERLKLIYDYLNPGREVFFDFSVENAKERKAQFKDYICPEFIKFHNFDFDINKMFARSFFVRDFGKKIKDDVLTRLTDLQTPMILSVDIIPLTPEEQKKLMENAEMYAESNVERWTRRPGAAKNYAAVLPLWMKRDRQIVKEYDSDINDREQEMFLCNITGTLYADTMDKLNELTDTLTETGYEAGPQTQVLGFRQYEGFLTSLPYGPRYISNLRDCTTENTAILMPFSSTSMNHPTGIPYGVHEYSKQEILIDRRLLLNGNEWISGVTGSGKSLLNKLISTMEILLTPGDLILIDPHGECTGITHALGGQVVSVGNGAMINPLEMCAEYGSIKNKSNLLITIFKKMVGLRDFTKEMESITDRCLREVIDVCAYNGIEPTLAMVYEKIGEQKEAAAKKLYVSLERFVRGSFDMFSGYTNINFSQRVICYDLSCLDSSMWDVAMTVIIENIWNRLIMNKERRIPTYIKVDEANRLLEDPELCSQFHHFYAEVRKYGGYVTGIIQNVNRLLSIPLAEEMLANSEIVIMLRQSSTDASEFKELYGLSKIQTEKLINANYGMGLIKCGNNIVPFNGQIEEGYIYDLVNTKPQHDYII